MRLTITLCSDSKFGRLQYSLRKLLETDSAELKDLSHDPDAAQCFRARTIAFVRQSLGFSFAEDAFTSEQIEPNPVITSFGVIGESALASCTFGGTQQSDILKRQGDADIAKSSDSVYSGRLKTSSACRQWNKMCHWDKSCHLWGITAGEGWVRAQSECVLQSQSE